MASTSMFQGLDFILVLSCTMFLFSSLAIKMKSVWLLATSQCLMWGFAWLSTIFGSLIDVSETWKIFLLSMMLLHCLFLTFFLLTTPLANKYRAHARGRATDRG